MSKYWHSVTLEPDYCNGCTHCLDGCPTEAIRIINGKATIIDERCIDCGECLKVCPFHAKGALSDGLEVLNDMLNSWSADLNLTYEDTMEDLTIPSSTQSITI